MCWTFFLVNFFFFELNWNLWFFFFLETIGVEPCIGFYGNRKPINLAFMKFECRYHFCMCLWCVYVDCALWVSVVVWLSVCEEKIMEDTFKKKTDLATPFIWKRQTYSWSIQKPYTKSSWSLQKLNKKNAIGNSKLFHSNGISSSLLARKCILIKILKKFGVEV